VLLTAKQAAHLAGPEGTALDTLVGLQWVGFPPSGSPAWHDELTGILRYHGIDLGPKAPEGQTLIADVKLTAVATGRAFALAPPNRQQPLPDHMTWSPLGGPSAGAAHLGGVADRFDTRRSRPVHRRPRPVGNQMKAKTDRAADHTTRQRRLPDWDPIQPQSQQKLREGSE
jgi:hypothetical protein